MARAFETVIDAWVADLTGPALQAHHVRVAKSALAQHSKEMPGAEVTTYVDGRRGAKEEQVKVGGVIRYEFARLGIAARFALTRCQALSPVTSGAYRRSWFIADLSGAPLPTEELQKRGAVMITNTQPYHRKLEMTVNAERHRGKARARLPAGIVDAVRMEIRRKYPGIRAEISFVNLPSAYVLKGRSRRKRKDAAAGRAITYPALIISIGD